MQTQEVIIKPTLKVILKADAQKLDEIVVTAMGISREKKALGYAVQEEKSEQNYFILLEERISYKIINVCLRSFRSHKLVSHERRNPTRIPKQQNI